MLVKQEEIPLAHNYVSHGPFTWNNICKTCGISQYEIETFVFTLKDDGTYSVKARDVHNLPDQLIIPTTHKGIAVTEVEDHGFATPSQTENTNTTTIIIPIGIKKIGYRAFCEFVNLETLELPEGLIEMEPAFGALYNLKSLTLPVSLTYIPVSTFSRNDSLSDVWYNGTKEQWKNVDVLAFNDPILGAKKHYLGDATANEYFVFNYLEDGTYSVAANDISNMPSEVVIPELYEGSPVTKIEDYAFDGCTNLTSITIPESVTTIGASAFSGCYYLTNVTLPESINEIGSDAFSSCFNISHMTIPSSMQRIAPNTFDYCYALSTVMLPEAVTEICENAFNACYGLSEIHYEGTESRWNEISIYYGNDYLLNATRYCKEEIPASPDEYFEFTLLENGTYSVKAKDRYNLPDELVIPSSYNGVAVTKIDENGFVPNDSYVNTNTTLIVIPDSILDLGIRVLGTYENLETVKFSKNLTTIGIGKLMNCPKLRNVYLPKSLIGIYDTAFLNCDNITDVYFSGTEEQWNNIGIGEWNGSLETATVHYNTVY